MSLIDRSDSNWKRKGEVFNNIQGLSIVTPSEWLADLVKKSFLSCYPIKVIHNGVDISLFKPNKGDILDRIGANNKRIILGVAALWERRKGLKDFIDLSTMLSPEEYQIVLVGLSGKQLDELPSGIIGIKRTNSVQELVELYSAAEVYLNLTYEDNYPTTNLESIACGTPVISYDTGGSGESARIFGTVVKKGDLEGIVNIIENKLYPPIRDNHLVDFRITLKCYIELYESVMCC